MLDKDVLAMLESGLTEIPARGPWPGFVLLDLNNKVKGGPNCAPVDRPETPTPGDPRTVVWPEDADPHYVSIRQLLSVLSAVRCASPPSPLAAQLAEVEALNLSQNFLGNRDVQPLLALAAEFPRLKVLLMRVTSTQVFTVNQVRTLISRLEYVDVSLSMLAACQHIYAALSDEELSKIVLAGEPCQLLARGKTRPLWPVMVWGRERVAFEAHKAYYRKYYCRLPSHMFMAFAGKPLPAVLDSDDGGGLEWLEAYRAARGGGVVQSKAAAEGAATTGPDVKVAAGKDSCGTAASAAGGACDGAVIAGPPCAVAAAAPPAVPVPSAEPVPCVTLPRAAERDGAEDNSGSRGTQSAAKPVGEAARLPGPLGGFVPTPPPICA